MANAVRAAVKDIEKLNATGDLIIRAETLGGDQAAADYTTEAGETELSVGSTVLLADDYQGGGKAGRTYRYRGLTADYTSSYGLGENDATAYQVELVKKEEGDSFDRGTTVLVSEGYDSLKGSAGTLYEWVGADGTVAGSATGRLTEQNYLDTALWRAVTPDTRTLSTEDYSNSRLWELCDGSIIATAISASLSGAFGGKFGGAASGAGAIATNVILSSTKATLENSDVESVNDVSVTAKDTSSIIASVSAWSVASGVGGDAAMAGSLGVSIARNFIGYDQARASVPGVGVFANIQNSSITASGNLQVLATAQNQIDSFVLAGSVAATYSGAASLSASGSGVYSVNRIGNHVSAVITGSQDDITASSVSVSAVDESKISSIADAVSVAIAVGGFGGAFSLGISLAQNSVATETTASVSAVQIATTGPVAVTARDNTAISAFAVSVSVSGATTLAISGGGTDASNIINTKTNAIIENAAIGSDTQKVKSVTVSAVSTSLVDSEVGAVSASISAGVALGVGVALARNFIGWDPKGLTTLADYSSTDRPATLRRGKRVRVMSGPHEGDVYEFIGDDVTDGDLTLDGPQPINLDQQTWYDTSLWELVNIAERPAEIQAQIIETSIHATDAITVEATGQQKIDSLVYAGAIAVGGSFGASGAGVNAENRVNTIVTAAIDGDGSAADTDGISAGTVVLAATDSSGIKSVAAAASIAGGGGGAVSVGVSLAENIVSNLVDAHIKNCDEGVVTTNGIISIRARATGDSVGSIALSESFTIAQLDDASKEETDAASQETDRAGDAAILSMLRGLLLEQGIPLAEDTDSDSLRIAAVEEGVKWNLVAPDGEVLSLTLSLDGASIVVSRSTITAVSAAASIAVGWGSVAVSGAGANARNTITSDAFAYVDSSLLGTETQNIGDVQINASSDSVIHALVLAASLSGGSQALSIGAARSRNTIGSDSEIRAQLKNTSVKSSGTVSLNAVGRQEIDAVVVAGSVAVAGSPAMSVAASGAGARAVNDIGNTIDASISGDNETAVHVQQVELDAKDVSKITSWVGAASLSASFAGGSAPSLSIGVGLARNTITTTVTSGISDAADINTQAEYSTSDGVVSSLKTGDRVLVEPGYLEIAASSTD
ncbi:MAG: hypothetical protein K0U52_09910, partial [Gammaproteobacteria bacterium]|nr:hypothetical protein [Gammaproteobacteria bacterium]